MSAVQTPSQSDNSATRAGARRQDRVRLIFSLVNLAAIVLVFIAIRWDQNERTKQIEHLNQELKQLQSQMDALEGQADRIQKERDQKTKLAEPGKKAPSSAASSP